MPIQNSVANTWENTISDLRDSKNDTSDDSDILTIPKKEGIVQISSSEGLSEHWNELNVENEFWKYYVELKKFSFSGLGPESKKIAETFRPMRISIENKMLWIKNHVADYIRVTNILRTDCKKRKEFFYEYNLRNKQYSSINQLYERMNALGPRKFYEEIQEIAASQLSSSSRTALRRAPKWIKILWPEKTLESVFGETGKDFREEADIVKDIEEITISNCP